MSGTLEILMHKFKLNYHKKTKRLHNAMVESKDMYEMYDKLEDLHKHAHHHPDGPGGIGESHAHKIRATVECLFDLWACAMRYTTDPHTAFENFRSWFVELTPTSNEGLKKKFLNLDKLGIYIFYFIVAKLGISRGIQSTCYNFHQNRSKPLSHQAATADWYDLLNSSPVNVNMLTKIPEFGDYLIETHAHISTVGLLLEIVGIKGEHDIDKLHYQSAGAYTWKYYVSPKLADAQYTAGFGLGAIVDTVKSTVDKVVSKGQSYVSRVTTEQITGVSESAWAETCKGAGKSFSALGNMLRSAVDSVLPSVQKVLGLFSIMKTNDEAIGIALKLVQFYLLYINTNSMAIKIAVLISALESLEILDMFIDNLSAFISAFPISMIFDTKMETIGEEIKPKVEAAPDAVAQGTSGIAVMEWLMRFWEEAKRLTPHVLAYGAGALVCILTCRVIAPSAFKDLADRMKKVITDCGFTARAVVNIALMLKIFQGMFTSVLDYLRDTVYGKDPDPSKEFEDRVAKWVAVANTLVHDISIQVIQSSPDLKRKVAECFGEGVEIIQMSTKFHRLMSIINPLHRNVAEIHEIVNRDDVSVYRKVPTHICLTGTAGIGKSTLVGRIIKYTCDKHFAGNKSTYPRNNATKHWDGYKGQNVVVYDDAIPLNDAEACLELLVIMSCLTVYLPMASIQTKGTVFTSNLIVSTTNTTHPELDGMFCKEALWRRRDLLIRPRIKDQQKNPFTAMGVFNDDKFKELFPGQSSEDFPHLEFVILDPNKPNTQLGVCDFEGITEKIDEIIKRKQTSFLGESDEVRQARQRMMEQHVQDIADAKKAFAPLLANGACPIFQRNVADPVPLEPPKPGVLQVDIEAILEQIYCLDKINAAYDEEQVIYTFEKSISSALALPLFIDMGHAGAKEAERTLMTRLRNLENIILAKTGKPVRDTIVKHMEDLSKQNMSHLSNEQRALINTANVYCTSLKWISIPDLFVFTSDPQSDVEVFVDAEEPLPDDSWMSIGDFGIPPGRDLKKEFSARLQKTEILIRATVLKISNLSGDMTSDELEFADHFGEGNISDYKTLFELCVNYSNRCTFPGRPLSQLAELLVKYFKTYFKLEAVLQEGNIQPPNETNNTADLWYTGKFGKKIVQDCALIPKNPDFAYEVKWCDTPYMCSMPLFRSNQILWNFEINENVSVPLSCEFLLRLRLVAASGANQNVVSYAISPRPYMYEFEDEDWKIEQGKFFEFGFDYDLNMSLRTFCSMTPSERRRCFGIAFAMQKLKFHWFYYLGRSMERVAEVRKKLWNKVLGVGKYIWSKIKIWKKPLTAIIIACSAIGICTVFAKTFCPKNQVTSGTAKEHRPPGVNRLTSGPAHYSLSRKIKDNTLDLRVEGQVCVGFGVFDHVMIIPHHTVALKLQRGKRFSLEYLNSPYSKYVTSYGPEHVTILPNSDICFVHHTSVPSFKDVRSMFMTENDIANEEKGDVAMIFTKRMTDDGCIQNCQTFPYNRTLANYNIRLASLGTKTYGIVHELQRPVVLGDSGAPVINWLPNAQHPRVILGFQSAANNNVTFVTSVSQEKVQEVVDAYRHVGITHMVPPELEDMPDAVTTSELQEHVRPDMLFTGTAFPMDVKSDINETPFMDWGEPSRCPSVTSRKDPRCSWNHPLAHSLNKYGRGTIVDKDGEYFKMAARAVAQDVKGQGFVPRYLPFRECITGNSNMSHLPLNTSPGYPWVRERKNPASGKKEFVRISEDGEPSWDPRLEEKFYEYLELMKQGIIPPHLVYTNAKSELRPPEKAIGLAPNELSAYWADWKNFNGKDKPRLQKTRSVDCYDMVFSLIYRHVNGALTSFLNSKAEGTGEYFPGYNVHGFGPMIDLRACEALNDEGYDFDVGNWDGHMSPGAAEYVALFNNECYDCQPGDPYYRVRICLEVLAQVCFLVVGRVVCRKWLGECSGFPGTTHTNTIYHILVCLVQWVLACLRANKPALANYVSKRRYTKDCIYGDDRKIVIAAIMMTFFNGDFIKADYESRGLPVTSGTKTGEIRPRPIRELTFLKRIARDDEVFGGWVRAALDKEVIRDIIFWNRNKQQPRSQLQENVLLAQEEMSAWGSQHFNDFKSWMQSCAKRDPRLQFLRFDSYEVVQARCYNRLSSSTGIIFTEAGGVVGVEPW